MAADRINIDRVAETIMQDLEIYAQNTIADVEYAVNKTAKLAKEELQDTAPVQTGAYSKSWAVRRHPYSGKDYNAKVVYAKAPQHGKTHLLEHPHAAPDGSLVAPRPHIKRVEEKAQRWMSDLLAKRLNERR